MVFFMAQLGMALSQDSSDHHDYEVFLGSGIPN